MVRLFNREFESAISDFTKTLKFDGRMPRAYANRGLAFLLSGKEAEAQKDFDAALTLCPELRAELEPSLKYMKERQRSRQPQR